MARSFTFTESYFIEASRLDGVVTWVEIDLDAIAFNARAIKQHIGPTVELIAVVKADTYGRGAVPVAHTTLAFGATASFGSAACAWMNAHA